ncbi:MAG: hypothetical protein PHQ43_09705 [Dehalococcoidales bacterium]|nr:hypothetical protein [Dehalococcoidales bacterium]
MVVIGGSSGIGTEVLSTGASANTAYSSLYSQNAILQGYNAIMQGQPAGSQSATNIQSFTKTSALGNLPVATYSHSGEYASDWLNKQSTNASRASVLYPDPSVGQSLIQTINSPTATAAEKTQASKDYTTWQQEVVDYLKNGGYAKQQMLAEVISAHSTENWANSSVRVYVDGKWQTLPDAYQSTYGGDPYYDATSKSFLEASLAGDAQLAAEAQAHKDSLAAKATSVAKSLCSSCGLTGDFGVEATPTQSGDVVTPDDIALVGPDGQVAAPSGSTGLGQYLNTKTLLLAIVAIGALYLIFSVLGGGEGE